MIDLARIRSLAAMPLAELRARHNALPELLAEINKLIPILEHCTAIDASSESSHEMASLAGAILHVKPLDHEGKRDSHRDCKEEFNALVDAAHRLAGSVMSQYDPQPDDPELPLDEAATRSLIDAQSHGQAQPLTRTVAIGPDTTGPKG